MSIGEVKSVIRKIRDVVREWDAVGETEWREDHTRYGVIDPLLRALGWDTADPKVCHPEFPRPFPNRVDYALFADAGVEAIVRGLVVPDVIVEAKALRTQLDDGLSQLRSYTTASPRMREGVAVMASGDQWWLFKLSLGGAFTSRLVKRVDILEDDLQAAAETLVEWLARTEFGSDAV